MAQFGPYHYADGCLAEKSFPAEGGNQRRFSVLIARALDANGLVAHELNGLAVLDRDNRSIVFDRHASQPNGLAGPSPGQVEEFRRVMAMDWPAFSAFCRQRDHYRPGNMPDVAASLPWATRKPVSDEVVFAPGPGDVPPDCPYDMTLRTRRAIVSRLQDQPLHVLEGGDVAPSWNVKVDAFDASGGDYVGHFGLSRSFDARWEHHCDKDPDVFALACVAGLAPYLEGGFSPFLGDGAHHDFRQVGRSGGHLALVGMGDTRTSFPDVRAYLAWLEDPSTPGETLVALYKAYATLDARLGDPGAEVTYQVAFVRKAAEAAWLAERLSLTDGERAAIEVAERDGAQFYADEEGWWCAMDVADGDDAGPFETEADAALSHLAERGIDLGDHVRETRTGFMM